MTLPITFSLLFYTAFATYFFWGVLIFSFNIRSRIYRIFFFCCLTLSIWAFAFSISNSAPDAETSLFWRRVAAFGWGPFYSLLLHFILLLTENHRLLKKKWVYSAIYLPALWNIWIFSLHTPIAVQQYDMVQIYSGWVNVSSATIWDRLYQFYYVIFMAVTIWLVCQWGRNSTDRMIKLQARLIAASYLAALGLGSLTELFLNRYTPLRVPQLAPVIVLMPVIVMFLCVWKYGLMVPRRAAREADEVQILSEDNRSQLYRHIAQANILGGFISFGAQYFNSRESLESALLFLGVMVSIGMLLHLVQMLNVKILDKDVISSMIMSLSIPLFVFKYIDYNGFYALSVPMIYVIVSIVFSRKWLLVILGASTILSLIGVAVARPEAAMTVEVPDHVVRIFLFIIFLWAAFYINQLYLQRLAEKQEQVNLQRLVSQISSKFVSASEAAINEKLNEALAVLGSYFKTDRAYLIFFSREQGTPNTVFEWRVNGIPALAENVRWISADVAPPWLKVEQIASNTSIYYSRHGGAARFCVGEALVCRAEHPRFSFHSPGE